MFQKKRTTQIVVLITATVLLAISTSYPALAVPSTVIYLEVDTTVDDISNDDCSGAANDCSLRGAIQNANSGDSSARYQITLPSGVFTFDEVGSGEDNNATGDLDIRLRTVTLTGAGTNLTTIDAAALDRALKIYQSTVTIEHLGIINGSVPSGDGGGGAILNGSTSHLYLYDVLIEHNTVLGITESYDYGGGIANYHELNITDSTITDNEACGGGGVISNNGYTTITHSVISENTARSGSLYCGRGGGIATYSTVFLLNLDHVLLEGNTANEGGGLYYHGGSNMTLRNSTFRNNGASVGGGLENSGVLTLEHTTVSGNQASGGGGGIYNGGTLTMSNVTVSANQSAGTGGLYNSSNKSITMDHCTIAGNTSTSAGFGYALSAQANALYTIHNTILASDMYGSTCKYAIGGLLTDLGYNLSTDDSCGFSASPPYHDLPNTGSALYTLADNGGPTETMAFAWGAAGIDRADPSSTDNRDQRYAFRPVNGDLTWGDVVPGAVNDIGAYEYGGYPPNVFFWLPLIMKAPVIID